MAVLCKLFMDGASINLFDITFLLTIGLFSYTANHNHNENKVKWKSFCR